MNIINFLKISIIVTASSLLVSACTTHNHYDSPPIEESQPISDGYYYEPVPAESALMEPMTDEEARLAALRYIEENPDFDNENIEQTIAEYDAAIAQRNNEMREVSSEDSVESAGRIENPYQENSGSSTMRAPYFEELKKLTHSEKQRFIGRYQDAYFTGEVDKGFRYYLADMYRKYASMENYEHDFEERAKFKARATGVDLGETVNPEAIAHRTLPHYAVQDLVNARRRIMWAFHKGSTTTLPFQSAIAQSSFDCWMEQQEENHQPHDVDRCRSSFYDAMRLIEAAYQVKYDAPAASDNACAPAAKPVPALKSCLAVAPTMSQKSPKQSTCNSCNACNTCNKAANNCTNGSGKPSKSYQVYFDFDKDVITAKGATTLQKIVSEGMKSCPDRITVKGHTDLSGKQSYNKNLSKRRLKNVANRLLKHGVHKDRLALTYHGESLPSVDTPDGTPEQRNRRVEVTFSW